MGRGMQQNKKAERPKERVLWQDNSFALPTKYSIKYSIKQYPDSYRDTPIRNLLIARTHDS